MDDGRVRFLWEAVNATGKVRELFHGGDLLPLRLSRGSVDDRDSSLKGRFLAIEL